MAFQDKNGSIPFGDPDIPEKVIGVTIKRTFDSYKKLIHAVVDKKLKGLIVSGAAGCGKSHEMEIIVNETLAVHPERRFALSGSSISPVNLYQLLWENQQENDTIIIDDCDNIMYDAEGLNMLKRALDTKNKRIIGWAKESKVLADMGIPKQFEFKGRAMVATNVDFRWEASRTNRLAKHMEAFIDRLPYLDLGIRTKRELFVRIFQVMQQTNFRAMQEMELSDAKEILSWIRDNLAKIHRPSVRAVIECHNHMKIDREGWKDLAEVTLFSR